MTSSFKRTNRRCRGTAMAETLLALPFLLLILLFVLYFGRESVRVERTHMMDRYEAWRQAGHGPGPHPDDVRGHPQMNDAFFAEHADSLGFSSSGAFPDAAAREWEQEAGNRSDDAGELARMMIENLAGGRTVHASSTHTTTNKLLQQFNGPARATHTTMDHDWKFVNGIGRRGGAWDQRAPYASNLGSLRDVFYQEFDTAFAAMTGNPFAAAVRSLYLSHPEYRGPNIDPARGR